MNYDTIVVGAGSAGAIVATRLSEDPGRSVLLLEAGPDYPEIEQLPDEIRLGHGGDRNIWARAFGADSKFSWNYVGKSTDEAEPMLVPRGRIVGGSSAVNAMIFLRGVPEDYDGWASAGNDEWGFRDLLPCFRRVENDLDVHDDFHGADGPIVARRFAPDEWNDDQRAFYDACRAAGYTDCPDHNNPDSTGVGPLAFNTLDGVRWSTAIGYLPQARHRLNLTIRADCLVHKVILDGGRAVGVMVESRGETFAVYGDEIVLSGGPIGSPHLLMLSGIGDADHLGSVGIPVAHHLPGVGRNFRDHPQAALIWKTKPGFRQDELAPKLQIGLRYTAEGSELRNDMYILAISFVTEEGYYYPSDSEPLGIGMVPHLNLALGSGRVSLSSADPHEQPDLDYNYLREPFDRQRLREAVHICLELAEREEYRSIIEERVTPTDAELRSDSTLDEWLKRHINTSHHISGTCKMGPDSDSLSVVDQHGRVRGIEGLRVADASIMPDCIRANTNVTTMVIGERIADFIKQGL